VNNHSHDASLRHGGGAQASSPDLFSRRDFLTVLIAGSLLAKDAFAQTPEDTRSRFRRMSEEAERKGLAEPFKGITKGEGTRRAITVYTALG
jgi:hypothetical protein